MHSPSEVHSPSEMHSFTTINQSNLNPAAVGNFHQTLSTGASTETSVEIFPSDQLHSQFS
jgi:hypothetical protein